VNPKRNHPWWKHKLVAWAAAAIGAAAITTGAILGKSKTGEPSQEEQITRWIKEAEPQTQTFCPPVEDRKFWGSKQKAVRRQDLVPDFTAIQAMDSSGLIGVIEQGTEQELAHNSGVWIPTMEEAIKRILNLPWSEKLQGKEFTDLHASQKAASLARAIHGLKNKVNPQLVELTKQAIAKKVTGPFLKEAVLFQKQHISWQKHMCPWLEAGDNWTAVCINNILYAILATEESAEVRAHAIAISLDPLNNYLASFETDGYLRSGIRYWNYGLGNLLVLAHRLRKATGGHIDLLKNPLLEKIGRFKYETLIARINQDEYFPLFADNTNPTARRLWMEELCHRSLGSPAPEAQGNPPAGITNDLMLWLPERPMGAPSPPKIDTTFYESLGVLIARHENKEHVLAAQGGINSGEHNHQDIGSYTLFQNGAYITGDPGCKSYTMEQFGNRRYTLDLQSSWGHPVPCVDNHLQGPLEGAVGVVLERKDQNNAQEITYDIKSAYATPGLTKLTRTLRFQTQGKPTLTITDAFEANHPISFETAAITTKATINGNTAHLAGAGYTITFQGTDTVELKVEDFWRDNKPTVRIGASLANKATKGSITQVIEPK
jgi:hypothetical protein